MKFPNKHPAIIGTITTASGLRKLARAGAPADAAEVRVDALLAAKVSVEKIEAALKMRLLPVLLTLRIPAEGGQLAWKTAHRRETWLRLLPLVEAIDVELASVRAMASVLAAARKQGKTIVFSAHSIGKPATEAQVKKWLGRFESRGPVVLKIAAHIASWRDLQRLAGLLIDHPDWPIAVMGLGAHAPQSRSVLASLGSRLVYGYLDKPAAPGQPSAAEVRKMVEAVTLGR